jgi:hypothetical protein
MKRFYLSHRISAPTLEGQHENCRKAIEFAHRLNLCYPDIELYVPGLTEPFVEKAIQQHKLSVEEVLAIDCEIILKDCDGAIFYVPLGLSKGMKIELQFCEDNHIPWTLITDIDEPPLTTFLKGV